MSIRYDADGSDRAMKTPLLASLFRAIGALAVLGTALLVFATLSQGQKIASVPAAFIVGGVGGLLSIAFFGVGQVLTSIARIEYYSSTEKNEAILHSLHKIEGHLAAIRERKEKA